MDNSIKTKLEDIFNTYKFSPEQSSKAAVDLIQAGEALTLDELSTLMSDEQKAMLDSLFSVDMTEEKVKGVYEYVNLTLPLEKINEVRNRVYDKLLADYINHMNS